MPDEVEFATKPELAMRMLARALDAGVPAGWVTADEVYGQHFRLRRMLEERQIPYVLAVPVNQRVIATSSTGKVAELRADALATAAAGAGVEEDLRRRRRQRARACITGPGPRSGRWRTPASYWLLVRRSLTDPTDLAYYLCYGPERTPLRELVRVAGARWAIEETFQTAKGQVGLDQYQVRRYDAWYRHITLAMLAHAFLTITTAGGRTQKGGGPHPIEELIPLTVPEVRRLLADLIWHQPLDSPRRPGLVTLAAPTPSPRPTLPLRRPRRLAISAAVVL